MKSLYDYFSRRVFQKDFGSVVPPSVEIDLTNTCNQRCFYCNVEDYIDDTKDRTSIEDYLVLVEKVANWGQRKGSHGNVNTLTFVGGGEPTMRKGYEKVVQTALELGLMTSIVTNGTNLGRLHKIPIHLLKKLSWIGVDIDSGDQEIYEYVRRPKAKNDLHRVADNILSLARKGVRVDIKCLLLEETSGEKSIRASFEFASQINARLLYFRPALKPDGEMFPVSQATLKTIETMSASYGVQVRLNLTRSRNRSYQYCHALFLLPVFSADGSLYLCCENRGDDAFKLCDWRENDFRDLWGQEKHREIYNNINVSTCQACRPHIHNEEIQKRLNNESFNDDLFF